MTTEQAETVQQVENVEAAKTDNNHELIHEHTLYAEPIGHIGGLAITNSLLMSWLALIIIFALSVKIGTKIKTIPGKIQSATEIIIEGLMSVFDGVTGSRAKTVKFAPFVFTFFFFILFNNWIGLLPGVGSIGQVIEAHGEKIFVPYLRGGTADYNTTLALAIIGIVASHIFGVIAVGAWKHFNKFINIQAILDIPRKIKKDWTVIMVNPIKFFIGIIELISEFAKIASLSLRLFGNVFAGEVLLASISAMLAFVIPIPFMFLEIFVGLVQAFIFSVLILVYISLNTTAEEH